MTHWLDWIAVAVFAASAALAWRSNRLARWVPATLSDMAQKVLEHEKRMSVLEYERRVRHAEHDAAMRRAGIREAVERARQTTPDIWSNSGKSAEQVIREAEAITVHEEKP